MRIFSVLLLALLAVACNDDTTVTPPEEVEDPGFFALKVGNIWEYQYADYDLMEIPELLDIFDRVEIVGTSVVDENRYFVIETTTQGNDDICPLCPVNGTVTRLVRDSLGYLIDSTGTILFSSENTEPYIENEFNGLIVYRELQQETQGVQVDAGVFECRNNLRYAIFPDGEMSNGRDDLLFSSGIGEIKRTWAGTNSGRIWLDRRLISFNIDQPD